MYFSRSSANDINLCLSRCPEDEAEADEAAYMDTVLASDAALARQHRDADVAAAAAAVWLA